MASSKATVLALSGGVGGAKLALGLADTLAAGELAVLVNTADDFVHLGLHISPDIDTLLYTLSGRSNETLGWGMADESWRTMDELAGLGGDTWFRLGDRDLATHLYRSQALAGGGSLTGVTAALAQRMGIASGIYPMTDHPVATVVHTPDGELSFQHYFVKHQCEPTVTGFHFAGIAQATPTAAVLELLHSPALRGVILCPSNPFVSIDPILRLPGIVGALNALKVPIIAVSPIVAGMAIKGPAAKMMAELGMPVTAPAVAQHYCAQYPGLLDYFVIDESDATLVPAIEAMGLAVTVAPTIMKTRADKQALAKFTVQLMGSC